MTYKCELVERPTQPMIAIHTHSAVQDLPKVLGQSYGAIMQYLGQTGQQPTGAPFVAYHNEDMQNLDIEVGFPVSGAVRGKDNIQPGTLPAGKAVTCLHVGPYAAVGEAYTALMAWMKEHGYEGTGVCYEFYLNDAAQTPPEALQTQIVMPLRAN